jgi:hypothetical protein
VFYISSVLLPIDVRYCAKNGLIADIAPCWTSRKSTEQGAAQFYEASNMTAPEFRAFDLSPLP